MLPLKSESFKKRELGDNILCKLLQTKENESFSLKKFLRARMAMNYFEKSILPSI